MIQKIAIKRFKKFKEIEVELGPFSILMGENSSGKTTVMQAINLSLNTLYKYDYITQDSAGQNKVRQKGVGMTSIPGMSLSDNRDLFYAKVSRGKTEDASINQGAVIELTDEKSNVFKMQIRENFGSFNIKCVSLASDVQNHPEIHAKAPLFISGFIGLKSTEERVFPMVIQDKMRSRDCTLPRIERQL
jgi:predicted ATP-dependent endonuclease of OLD family